MCAQYRRPNGVTFSFQVCLYSIEPPKPNRSLNLLPNQDDRATLADEIEEHGPKVAFIGSATLLTASAPRLAGQGSAPDGLTVWPSSETQGLRPA